MPGLLDGLDDVERFACRVAERVLGVVAIAHDVAGRQGAVDAFLEYADGRRAAFEVTRLAGDQGALQLDQLLSRDGHAWSLPGNWRWTVSIGSPRDLPRLREVFRKIVLMCEEVGVAQPEQLRWMADIEPDADLAWLVEDSTVRMQGHPNVSAVAGQGVLRATITLPSLGGFVDETLAGLEAALSTALAAEHIRRRVAKLSRTQADERHLFVFVGMRDLPFNVADALAFGDAIPPGPLPLMSGITHLWLAPHPSNRVLLAAPDGWIEAHPYDSIR
jgi:hypothetical protein